MTGRRLLIECGPVETRAALQEGDQFVALWIGPPMTEAMPPVPGERMPARIKLIDKKLGAAFVELAGGINGFLKLPGKQQLAEGAEVVVEIMRAARPGKLADVRLSSDQRAHSGPRPSAGEFVIRHFEAKQDDEIAVAGKSEDYLALKKAMPDLVLSSAGADLFERTDAETAFEQASAGKVDLPGGGWLAFDEGEALTAVDVNTGAAGGQSKAGTLSRACLAAVPELVRQIGLRGIGGQVVADFPLARQGMEKVESAFRDAAKRRRNWHVHFIRQTGTVLLVVPRRLPSLLDSITEQGTDSPRPGRQFTTNHLAARALRKAEAALLQDRTSKLVLKIPADVDALIRTNPHWLRSLCDTYGERLTLQGVGTDDREWSDVRKAE